MSIDCGIVYEIFRIYKKDSFLSFSYQFVEILRCNRMFTATLGIEGTRVKIAGSGRVPFIERIADEIRFGSVPDRLHELRGLRASCSLTSGWSK